MARRSQSSAQPPAAPSPATTRRLLKEHASIQQELGDPSFSPSGEPSVLPGGEEKVGLSGGEGTQMQNQRRKRSKVANPDLIELRPWDADGEDLFEWFAVIRGPKGGAYEGEWAGVVVVGSREKLLWRVARCERSNTSWDTTARQVCPVHCHLCA